MATAPIWKRIIAGAIDIGILAMVWTSLERVLGPLPIANWIVYLSPFLLLAYDIPFDVFNRGRTPGKMLFGLAVMRVDGRAVDPLASFIRSLLRWIDFLPFAYAIGIGAALLNGKGQRLGDLAAGTVVVDYGRRKSINWTPANARKPVSQLPEAKALAIRTYLDAEPNMPEDVRTSVLNRLWASVGEPGLPDVSRLRELLGEHESGAVSGQR